MSNKTHLHFSYEELAALAHRRELGAARRLVQAGRAPREALAQAMAGGDARRLEALLAARRAERAADAAARAARAGRREGQRAARAARHLPPAGSWVGHFDGSALPNPGRLGIGAVLAAPDGQCWRLSRAAGHGDSGMAEYLALIAVLEQAVAAGAAPLRIYGDSRVVLDDVAHGRAGNEARCARALAPWRERALALLTRLPDVTLAWIPRARNAAADTLSRQAIGYHADMPIRGDAHG